MIGNIAMNVTFHDQGMDMVDLPRILKSKKVGAAIPNYLKGPPLLSVTRRPEQ